jgi:hypothetical protein
MPLSTTYSQPRLVAHLKDYTKTSQSHMNSLSQTCMIAQNMTSNYPEIILQHASLLIKGISVLDINQNISFFS